MDEQDDARNEVNRNEVNRRQVWEVLVYRTLAGLEAATRELRKAGVTDGADLDISVLMNEFVIEATLDDRDDGDQAAPETTTVRLGLAWKAAQDAYALVMATTAQGAKR